MCGVFTADHATVHELHATWSLGRRLKSEIVSSNKTRFLLASSFTGLHCMQRLHSLNELVERNLGQIRNVAVHPMFTLAIPSEL